MVVRAATGQVAAEALVALLADQPGAAGEREVDAAAQHLALAVAVHAVIVERRDDALAAVEAELRTAGEAARVLEEQWCRADGAGEALHGGPGSGCVVKGVS